MNATLYCHCSHAKLVSDATRLAVLEALSSSGEGFDAVPDLCGVAAEGGPGLEGRSRILACAPRAVRALLDRAGVDLGGAQVVNLREVALDGAALDGAPSVANAVAALFPAQCTRERLAAGTRNPPREGALEILLWGPWPGGPSALARTVAALLDRGYAASRLPEGAAIPRAGENRRIIIGFGVLAREGLAVPEGERTRIVDLEGLDLDLEAILRGVEEARARLGLARPSEWIPWFPVIDRTRCTQCRQCAEFCLFGVYEVASSGEVVVVEPSHCKTNCPACARICPALAIIFPKYALGPLSGGEVESRVEVPLPAEGEAEGGTPGVVPGARSPSHATRAVDSTGGLAGGPVQVNLEALRTDGFRSVLRSRTRPRFSTELPTIESAAREADAAPPRDAPGPAGSAALAGLTGLPGLSGLTGALAIPAEVLRALSKEDRDRIRAAVGEGSGGPALRRGTDSPSSESSEAHRGPAPPSPEKPVFQRGHAPPSPAMPEVHLCPAPASLDPETSEVHRE